MEIDGFLQGLVVAWWVWLFWSSKKDTDRAVAERKAYEYGYDEGKKGTG